MYRRSGKTSGTGMVGPHPCAANYREWWTKELAYNKTMLADASASGDVRLMRLASRRIREAAFILAEVK